MYTQVLGSVSHISPVKSRLHQRRQVQQSRFSSAPPELSVNTASSKSEQLAVSASVGGTLAAYDVFEVVGQGSAGVVRRARRQAGGQDVALKMTSVPLADAEMQATARHEFEVLRDLEHPNIIRAFEFFTTANQAIVVLEFFQGAEIDVAVRRQSMHRFSESIARGLSRQLLEAVNFLHGRRVIHRDIKGSNMLVSDNLANLKLVDFNTAHRLADGRALTMTGTYEYAAPEVLLGASPSELGDVWSMGLCFHLMLAGRLPRCQEQYQSFKEFADAVSSKPVVLDGRPCWTEASQECKAVLQQCLEVKMSRRPAAMTLLRQDRWFSTNPSSGRVRWIRSGSVVGRGHSADSRGRGNSSVGSKKRSSSLPLPQ